MQVGNLFSKFHRLRMCVKTMDFILRIIFLLGLFTKKSYESEVVVYVNDSMPIFITNSKSPSVALGMNIFESGSLKYMNNPKLITLAKALGPSYLRMGGIRSDHATFYLNQSPKMGISRDCAGVMPDDAEYQEHLIKINEHEVAPKNPRISINYTGADFDLFMKFVNCAEFDLIFGLNLLGEKQQIWNPANTLQLLKYAKKRKYVINWELGNEPNSYRHKEGYVLKPYSIAKAFNKLNMILKRDPWWKKSLIIGPDANGLYKAKSIKFLSKFLHYGKYTINATTFHQYYIGESVATLYNFTDPSLLDELKPNIKGVVRVQQRQAPEIPVWLGETGSAFGGGAAGLSDRYVAGFMWLDKLGLCASYGIDTVFRQTFFHGNYALVDDNFNPRPDYWLTLLYKNLVGERVLDVTKTSSEEILKEHTSKLRVYAHCTKSRSPNYSPGSVTIYYLNLSKSNKTLTIKMDDTKTLRTALVYILTPPGYNLTSSDVCLNGEKLHMTSPHRLPKLRPKLVNLQIGERIILPKMSFGFVVLPDFLALACMEK